MTTLLLRNDEFRWEIAYLVNVHFFQKIAMPSPRLALSNLPPPERAKAFAVPTEDCGGFHNEDPGLPILPDPTEPCPQESIRGRQFRPLHGALKDSKLVAQRDNLQLERSTAPKRGE
jgi:hypothetical protein